MAVVHVVHSVHGVIHLESEATQKGTWKMNIRNMKSRKANNQGEISRRNGQRVNILKSSDEVTRCKQDKHLHTTRALV